MTVQTPRSDPIGDRYYRPLRLADNGLKVLFWVTIGLSFVPYFVDRASTPKTYDFVQIALVLAVVGFFALGLAIRLYLSPRAEDQRRRDFLSSVYGVPLTHEHTALYYNNNEVDSVRRFGATLLENAFFSKSIALKMALIDRIVVAMYVGLFFIAILLRSTDLAVMSTAAQAVFSEQIISRLIRLEWFRSQCGGIYNGLFELFQSTPTPEVFSARVIVAFATYETAKSNAAIVLSSRIFNKQNPALSSEWEKIKKTLNIK
jgi:hypothetical protein